MRASICAGADGWANAVSWSSPTLASATRHESNPVMALSCIISSTESIPRRGRIRRRTRLRFIALPAGFPEPIRNSPSATLKWRERHSRSLAASRRSHIINVIELRQAPNALLCFSARFSTQNPPAASYSPLVSLTQLQQGRTLDAGEMAAVEWMQGEVAIVPKSWRKRNLTRKLLPFKEPRDVCAVIGRFYFLDDLGLHGYSTAS